MLRLHEDLAAFARGIVRGDELPPQIQSVYPHHHAAAALAAYRNNYRGNLHDALAGAYPVVAQLVGHEFFRLMTCRFIAQYPSRSGNLHHYGEEMAAFIAAFPPARGLPYLPDVAMLEWACHCVYFAEDATALDIEALSRIAAERYPHLIARIHPAVHVIHSNHPSAAIWRAHQPGMRVEFKIDLDSGPTNALVSRRNGIVEVSDITAADAAWLRAMQGGTPLGMAVAATLERYPTFDLQAALLKLVAREVITNFTQEIAL